MINVNTVLKRYLEKSLFLNFWPPAWNSPHEHLLWVVFKEFACTFKKIYFEEHLFMAVSGCFMAVIQIIFKESPNLCFILAFLSFYKKEK